MARIERRWKLRRENIHFQEILFLLIQVIFCDEQGVSKTTSHIVDLDALEKNWKTQESIVKETCHHMGALGWAIINSMPNLIFLFGAGPIWRRYLIVPPYTQTKFIEHPLKGPSPGITHLQLFDVFRAFCGLHEVTVSQLAQCGTRAPRHALGLGGNDDRTPAKRSKRITLITSSITSNQGRAIAVILGPLQYRKISLILVILQNGLLSVPHTGLPIP